MRFGFGLGLSRENGAVLRFRLRTASSAPRAAADYLETVASSR
jgi:hypothetical protein